MAAFYRQFKGRCTNCGELGHKSGDCPNKDASNSGNKNGKKKSTSNAHCWYCGKKGHVKSQCSHRIKDMQGKTEKAKVALAESESDGENESVDELGFVAAAGNAKKSDLGNARRHCCH